MITDNTLVSTLTVGELRQILGLTVDSPALQRPFKRTTKGLNGICELFGVRHSTAQNWKNTWLAPACVQMGKTIIVDVDKALELARNRGLNPKAKA